jgi:HYR domain/Autotransporter beta-domain
MRVESTRDNAMKLSTLRNTARFAVAGGLGLLGLAASATTADAITVGALNTQLATGGNASCSGTSIRIDVPITFTTADAAPASSPTQDRFVFRVLDADDNTIAAGGAAIQSGMTISFAFDVNIGSGSFNGISAGYAISTPTRRPFRFEVYESTTGGIGVTTFNPTGSALAVSPTFDPAAGSGNFTAGCSSLPGGAAPSDTTPPVVTVPGDVTVDTDPALPTAIVSFTVSANDNVDGAITPTVTSSPTTGLSSGSAFPVGTTTVTASATDAAGNISTSNFTVTVTDNEDPVLTVPGNIAASTDPGVNTAVVTYAAPTATDNVAGVTVARTAGPASGAAFPLGVTTVTHVATDAAGNTDTESFTVTVTDNEDPVVTVPADITTTTDAGLPTAVVTFSTSAMDNVDGAITPVITSGPTTGLSSGSAFPIGITTVTASATDTQGNSDSESFTVTVGDDEAPVFTSAQADIDVEIDFNLTFAVVVFATPSASDNSGTVTVAQTQGITSGGSFPIGTTVVEFTATDPAGNTETLQFNVNVAIIPPGTVTFVVNSPDDGTVTFTSATTAFNTSVIVTGGTGSSGALQVVPGNYTATYGLPAGFAVTAASCSAASGTIDITTQTATMSFARGETYICTLSTRDIATQTGRQIQSFMDNRGRLIMANQPNHGRRIARVNGDRNPNTVSMFGNRVNDGFSPLGVAVSQNRVDLSFASSSASEDPLSARAEWDFWFEASVSRYETEFGEGGFAILHAGADYRIGENAILGFGVQLDSTQEDVIGSVATTSGMGWMIGPYYTARIGDGLYFDASLRYGRSENEVSPLGTYTDEFTTERWLASIGLFGSIDRGALNIQPNISINYFEETSEAYIDSLAVPIAARTTRLGDLEIGSRFTWYDPAGGFSTYFEIEGFYTFEANGQVASLSTVNTGLRARVGFGGTVMVGPSGSFDYGVSYDGLGDDDYEAMTARIGFSVNF